MTKPHNNLLPFPKIAPSHLATPVYTGIIESGLRPILDVYQGREQKGSMTVLSNQQDIDILITDAEIAARTNQLARIITDHFKGTKQLVVVGLLRGSFIFIADLVRRLALPVEVDFMTVSSYGNSMESSRQVRIIQDLETTIKDRDVLLVEDIVDTGHTLSQVRKILLTRSPKSLSVCTLLNKPSRREINVEVDWVGFDIPDDFVIGYGIDYAQQGRNLPHIGIVKTPSPNQN